MNKKKYFKYKFYCNSAYYASLIATLVLGIIIGQRVQKQNKIVQASEPAPKAQVQQIDTVKTVQIVPDLKRPTIDQETYLLRHKIDSLSTANVAMFDSVAERYVARLDSQYTLGRFFNKTEIAQLNKLAEQYIAAAAGDLADDTLINATAQIMPLTARTPLVTFETLVYVANIPQHALDKFGIVFDAEYIAYFTDARRQKTLQQYLDAYSNTLVDGDEPNFQIPEFASIQQRYNANKMQIAELQNLLSEHTRLIGF